MAMSPPPNLFNLTAKIVTDKNMTDKNMTNFLKIRQILAVIILAAKVYSTWGSKIWWDQNVGIFSVLPMLSANRNG